MNEMNIEILLGQLEETIRVGKKPFMGGGKIIDDMSALKIIDNIRQALPNSIAEARVIIQEKDEILNDARANAEDILVGAEREANRILNESEIIKQAQSQAVQIVDDATNYATNIVDQSYRQIAEVMNNTEYYLRQTLDDVTASKQDLIKTMNTPQKR